MLIEKVLALIFILWSVLYICYFISIFKISGHNEKKAIFGLSFLAFTAIILSVISMFNPPLPFNMPIPLFFGVVIVFCIAVGYYSIYYARKDKK